MACARLGAAPGGEDRGQGTDALDESLRAAGITPGEGTGRIQVVPSKEFRPRSLTSNPLQTKMNVAVELDRLRSEGEQSRSHARGPTVTLKEVLRGHQAGTEAAASPPAGPGADGMGKAAASPDGAAQKESFALYALARGEQRPGKEMTPPAPLLVFDQSPDFDFGAIRGAGVPFHVFDVDPRDTILVELSGDEVARVVKQEKDWAWIQLDSGLMGLVRNHHVAPAGEFEILKYLALEYGKRKEDGSGPAPVEGPVRVNLVDGSYQVTKKAMQPPARMKAGGPDEALPESEFEILRSLALDYGKAKEEGRVPALGGGPVRVNLVDGAYQVTDAVGREIPVVPRIEGVPPPAQGKAEVSAGRKDS